MQDLFKSIKSAFPNGPLIAFPERLAQFLFAKLPTAMAGFTVIIPSGSVHPVDISFPTMMKCISKWGGDSSRFLAAMNHK